MPWFKRLPTGGPVDEKDFDHVEGVEEAEENPDGTDEISDEDE